MSEKKLQINNKPCPSQATLLPSCLYPFLTFF